MPTVVVVLLQWLARYALVKVIAGWVIMSVMYYLMPYVWALVFKFIPIPWGTDGGISYFQGLFTAQGSLFLYLCAVFKVDYGVKLLLSSMIARFLIRRLPVVG